MKRTLNTVFYVALWLLFMFCLFSVFMINGLKYKLVALLLTLFIFPPINDVIFDHIKGKRTDLIRGIAIVVAIFFMLLDIAVYPLPINETTAVNVAMDQAKKEYPQYDDLERVSYDIDIERDEEYECWTLHVNLQMRGIKGKEQTDIKDNYIVYYDITRRKYSEKKPEER